MTRCPNCNSLLIVCGTGAVCSRDMSCGRVITTIDKAAINAEWTKIHNESVIAKLPRASVVNGPGERRFTIEGREGFFKMIRSIPLTEELSKERHKLPAENAVLAVFPVKGVLNADWYLECEPA